MPEPLFPAERLVSAHDRATPIALSGLIKSTPPQEALNTMSLKNAEIEDRCFAALGYMEELNHPLTPGISKAPVSDDISLRVLEAELDGAVPGIDPTQFYKDEVIDDLQRLQREEIKSKAAGIIAHPQVRERFQREFEREIKSYRAARKPMRQVRDIDRVTTKLRKAIYKKYLESKETHGKLTQSVADQIAAYQKKIDQLQSTKSGIIDTATPQTLGYLETQKLLTYKNQLKENGFVITPSREALIDRITREALAGKKIFLVGSTGTGKTELAFYALDSLTGGYEIVPWHEGTTPRDIFGYRELYENEKGQVESGVKPGPYPRALEKGVGLVHDEYTAGQTRSQTSMKYLMGARPGDRVHIPGFNGQVFDITHSFIEIFTGNPKDERTKERNEMDPAILRELTGVEVSYMSSSEMKDVILAKLIEENGVLRLGKTELENIKRLCDVAELMQKLHNKDFEGLTEEMRAILGIDNQGNTELTLNANFLDPGTLFKLFGEWELAHSRGQNFSDYLGSKLSDFLKDPKTLSAPEERKTLNELLTIFGFGCDPDSNEVQVAKPGRELGYTLPSEMAGPVGLSDIDPMSESGAKAETRSSPLEEFARKEQSFWMSKLKPSPGSVFEIPPLPSNIQPDLLEKFINDPGDIGLRSIPRLDIGTFDELKAMGTIQFIKRIESRYKGLHSFASLTIAQHADFSLARILEPRFWLDVRDGYIDFPDKYNEGGWYLMEVMPKPNTSDEYERTVMNDIFTKPSRSSYKAESVLAIARQDGPQVIKKLDLPSHLRVRLPDAAELNMILNRMESDTDRVELTSTDYQKVNNHCLIGLGTGQIDLGGSAYVSRLETFSEYRGHGFRLVIPLSDH